MLGPTLDDAAGEAFDKGARLLGLGYPGGAALERLARDGDPRAFEFPSGARMPGLDFSFAGLKTALLYRIRDLGDTEAERRRADLAASYQAAIVEALLIRVRGRWRRPAPTGSRSAAASPPTVRCARRWLRSMLRSTCRRGAVHRQRGDDRQRRALLRGAGFP